MCHSMTEQSECLYLCGPEPCETPSLWLFEATKIQNRIQCKSQPIRRESNDLLSGCVPYLMQDIATPPQPVTLLFLHNLLGYMGPTIVKPVLSFRSRPMG